jgi:hypothetical protein
MLSFAIGMFLVYIVAPPPEIVLKFPSPYNAEKVLYRDKSNTCYRYHSEKVSCTSGNVKPQPIMEDFKNKKNVVKQ